jgi:N-acetylglucosaminyl-diphospho-decaprenol L-rhamnosyltransferase
MLIPREAFDAVGGFDEGFPLYGEERDMATRLRALDRSALFTPAAEVIHAAGVSTGGDRRPHRLVVMHSQALYRYYAKHRASGCVAQPCQLPGSPSASAPSWRG